MTCLMLPFADLSAHADAAPAGGASWRATADRTPGLVRGDGEQPLELPLVAAVRLEAFLERPQQLDDRLADGLLQVAVARPGEAPFERLDRLAGRDAHDLEHVRDAGLLLGVVANLALRVGHRRLELLADHVRLVADIHGALLARARRRHLVRRLLEVHDPASDLRELPFGDAERLAVAVVEALGDVAGELE